MMHFALLGPYPVEMNLSEVLILVEDNTLS
ncbi:hypothetical protein GGR42_003096 [Saonia flava]|uniref:Uncharacterized protein n=1 Tax=Saonia flava TaxID=523696 RepID=A0A846R3R0_9FLAO|nr:hypothetical protein [Saonia flava]